MDNVTNPITKTDNSFANQLMAIYVFVDDFLKATFAIANWKQSNNQHPILCDAEVITIALMQGMFGCATLKNTYQIVASCFGDTVPDL